jgi:hypothetical protein
MAGHLPIPTNRIHNSRIKKALDMNISNQKPFEKIHVDTGYFQLLTAEYGMNDEHGFIDHLIFCFVPKTLDKIYEYHLDKNEKINQIYLVM